MSFQPRRDFLRHLSSAALALPALSALPHGASANEPRRPPIRVGQIGVGHAHAGKLAVYRQSPDYEVVGIVEPDEALRRQSQEQAAFKDLPWMTQEQLLNVPGLQAVLVETRVRDLLDTAQVCIAAGKHVHLDKPAGASLPQFRRILADAARQNLLVQMGYMFRYNPAVVLLRAFQREGWLGELFEVHAVMSKVVPPDDRRRLAEFRGGILFELGCHVIDLVIGLLGKPAEVTSFERHSAPLDDNLQDNMLAVFTYPKAVASVKSSALEVEGFARRHLVVCGSRGTFHIQPLDHPAARIALDTPRGKYRAGYQDVPFPRYTRYVDDAADMARIIRGEKPADFSCDHDLIVQETLLRACGMPLHE
jgi:predicted dehydrogenase